jgi:hypothetical protein
VNSMKNRTISAAKSAENTEPQLTLTPRRLLSFLIAAGGHWVFQSMLYMDRSERNFKLALDVLLTVPFALLLAFWWPGVQAISWPGAILGGLIVAHSLNYIFNAQLCALGANYGLVRSDYERLNSYAQALGRRAQQEPSIQYAAICGSMAQASHSSDSDLDVRILRYPGLGNGIRAGWFVLCERTRAQFTWFPLDIYLFDSDETIHAKLKSHETLTHLPHNFTADFSETSADKSRARTTRAQETEDLYVQQSR